MKLILGPENLSVDFQFSIEDANKKKPRVYNSIGVYLSGGIDSTALLLLILTELNSSGVLGSIPVRCFTIDKHDFAIHTTKPLISILERKFNVALSHHNSIPNYLNPYNIRPKVFLDMHLQNPNTLFFLGNNKTPSTDLVSFKNSQNIDYGFEVDKIIYYSPFLYMHKPQILDIFYKLDCEDILPYTYSCTVRPHQPCKKCYACEERAWGFEMLKKQDPLLAQN